MDSRDTLLSGRAARLGPLLLLLAVLAVLAAVGVGCGGPAAEREHLRLYDLSDRRAPRLVGRHDVVSAFRRERSPHEFYLWRDPARPGRVSAPANYIDKGQTHRVNNIGTSLFRLIGIGNMTPGDAAPSQASATKPELENRWYRAERLVIAPGASAPVPSAAGTVVVGMQTNGSAALDGKVWHPLNGPGDFARIDGTAAYVVHNRGASEIELVAIAVKGAK